MNTVSLYDDSISRLAAQSEAIGRLAQDDGAFAAVVAAFESQDPDAFRWVLTRLEMLPHCELICEWVRIKLCVLKCVELCGPPPEEGYPNLQRFARAIVHLAANEKALSRLVDAVSCGNPREYRDAVTELGLEEFCHVLCRWVCSIVYRRVCDIICTPVFVPRPDPVSDIRAAARVMNRLIADERALDVVAKAAETLDAIAARSAIVGIGLGGECEIICHLICSWRCGWATRVFCRRPSPVLTGSHAVEEARGFALASRKLALQPRALGSLITAVETFNAESYEEIVDRFGLGIYCEQLSTWVCSIVCREFCFRVCPPPALLPDFFKIGALDFQTQVDSSLPATGLTIGGTQAFFSSLRLNGILTQTLNGQPMEYMFEYMPVTLASTTLTQAATAADTTLKVASSSGFPASGAFNVSLGGADGGYEIVTVTGMSGTTWTVLRGQQGTSPLPASAGAAIVTGAAAGGSWTQVPQSWIARTVVAYQETVVSTPFPHIEITYYTVNGNPSAMETVIAFTADGWIPVPQGTDIALTNDMIVLDSSKLAAFASANETGVSASNPANPLMPTDLYFGIRMRVRQQGSTTESDGGSCGVIAVDNAVYANIDRHPEWGGGIISPQYGVAMLDIEELQGAGNGCKGITDQLTVLFTASHPNLGPVSIGMVGGTGGPYGFTLPAVPRTGNWYGTAANGFNLIDLEPCAYIVTLNVSLLLTTGDSDFPNPLTDQIAFCLT